MVICFCNTLEKGLTNILQITAMMVKLKTDSINDDYFYFLQSHKTISQPVPTCSITPIVSNPDFLCALIDLGLA